MEPHNKNSDLEMDLQNLISCIECHKDEKNVDVITETLKTIVNLCNEEETGKDAFREVGGLDFLLQFIIDTDQVFILEFGLKVLAFIIDGNVHNQMHLTEDKIFRILQAIFKKKTYPLSVLKNAILLFSTLLFQNRSAQDIIQENGSLLSLMNLYQCFIPMQAYCSNSSEDSEHLEVWLAVNSSLCFSVNNPLHEKNQETCSSLFPLSLKIIETAFDPIIIEATSSFLSLSIANNEKNQDLFAEMDGFPTLKHSLIRNFEEIQSCIKEYNNIIRKRTLQILNGLIAIISASVLDHEKNSFLCGELGIVSLMTKLVSTTALNSSATKKILLVLGLCVDACSENRFIILEVPKLEALLKRNLETNDQELHTAAKYLLQVCLNENNGENELNQDFYSEPGDIFLESCQHRYEEVLAQLGSNNFCSNNISYQQNNNNSVSGLSGIHDLTLSQEGFQKINTGLNPVKLKTKNSQNSTDQDHYIHDWVKINNFGSDTSESDSVEKISLHTAGHPLRFHRQIKMKEMDKNLLKSIQKNNLTRSCRVEEVCHLNTNVKDNDSDIRNLKTDCQKSKKRSSNTAPGKCCCTSRKLSHKKQKMSSLKHNNKKGMKRTLNKDKLLDPAHSSSKPQIGDSKPSNESRNYNENKSLLLETVPTVSAKPDLNKSATICKENFGVHSPNKKSALKEYQNTDLKISDISHSTVLQSFSLPCSFETDVRKSQKVKAGSSSKMYPSKTRGCMEVIVLPGITCNEHKLAAQFELLKVCELQTAKNGR